MAVSTGLILVTAAGAALSTAVEREGTATPLGGFGRSLGVDISGGAVGQIDAEMPSLTNPGVVDPNAIAGAVQEERKAIKKKFGRSATVRSSNQGLLATMTTGKLGD